MIGKRARFNLNPFDGPAHMVEGEITKADTRKVWVLLDKYDETRLDARSAAKIKNGTPVMWMLRGCEII